MFRGNFIAILLLIPFIFQLFLLSNVVGIDPNLSDPPIPPDLSQNGTSADAAPSPIPILMDNGETSGNGPSGNATSLENAKNVDKEAENQPTTVFGNMLSGNTASLENAELVGKMAEDQLIIVSEHERFGNATTLENAENVSTEAEDQPTIADNSLLTRMLGMDEKQERSIEKEVEENQRQVMDDGTMDSSVEEGEKERKRVPLQANADGDADQNANGNENKRGNRMRPCRSYFEDIAVLEPVDANVKMVYTSEVGTVRHQEYGQEDAKATSTRWQKEQLRQSTTIDSTDSKDSFKDINEDTMKEVTEKEKRVQTDHIHKYEAEVSLNANPEKAQRDQLAGNAGQGKQSGFNARVGVGGSYQNTESEYKSTKDTNERTNIKIDTSNQFNNIKKSTAMMESFKSTSGASELMEQSEFLQTTSAFTTRELVDIRISIPRNKKVIIKQLFFDCDGNIVKMPFILYTDGKERLKLQEQNASPKIKRPLSPNWANETSEDNLPKRKSMNVVSAPIEQNDDFDEFMNEYGA